jgi:hypothetical protein
LEASSALDYDARHSPWIVKVSPEPRGVNPEPLSRTLDAAMASAEARSRA